MDKITKALNRLNFKEKLVVKKILKKIRNNDFHGLDIKKLKGHNDIFRARKGKIRIIYRLINANRIYILTIERRSEKTYKF